MLDNGDRDHRYLALNHTCLITMENSKYEREVISLLAIESIEKFISTQLFGFEICFSKDTALVPVSFQSSSLSNSLFSPILFSMRSSISFPLSSHSF